MTGHDVMTTCDGRLVGAARGAVTGSQPEAPRP